MVQKAVWITAAGEPTSLSPLEEQQHYSFTESTNLHNRLTNKKTEPNYLFHIKTHYITTQYKQMQFLATCNLNENLRGYKCSI